jgi:Kef-type K+ transport system membrane component KefB
MIAKMLISGGHIGLILFMFVLGLQFNLGDWSLAKEKGLSLAFLGGAFSFILSALGSYYCWPHADIRQHLLVGAVFATTSAETAVSLYSRYGKLGTQEASTLLNSAMITDLQGVLLLGGVVGLMLNNTVSIESWDAVEWNLLLYSIVMTVTLVLGASFIGVKLSPQITRILQPIQSPSIVFLVGLLLIAVLSWLSDSIGLTALIGAYASGVILRGVRLNSTLHRLGHFEDLFEPFAAVIIPLFFVVLGIQTHLEIFSHTASWIALVVMFTVALVGMQLPGALWSGTTMGRFVIGASLISRGELALIILFVGSSYSFSNNVLLSSEVMAPLVIAVVLTSVWSAYILHRILPRLLEPAQGMHRYERGSSTSSHPIVTGAPEKEQ